MPPINAGCHTTDNSSKEMLVGDRDRKDVYLPSPSEIRQECRAIQSGWSDSERERRARGLSGRQRTVLVSSRRFAKLAFERNESPDDSN